MVAERHPYHAVDAAAMEALGAALAHSVQPGACIWLSGPLAAGKTTLARGYMRALGHTGAVKSPTFTLVESYLGLAREVHHFDLYRLAEPAELEFLGIDEYLDGRADVLIEWPERGQGCLGPADVTIDIVTDGSARNVSVDAGNIEILRKFEEEIAIKNN